MIGRKRKETREIQIGREGVKCRFEFCADHLQHEHDVVINSISFVIKQTGEYILKLADDKILHKAKKTNKKDFSPLKCTRKSLMICNFVK